MATTQKPVRRIEHGFPSHEEMILMNAIKRILNEIPRFSLFTRGQASE